MKNQYFGDVNDFLKYDLVLTLIEKLDDTEAFTFMPMLTRDDSSRDGGLIKYDGGRRKDLEEFLKEHIHNRDRNILNLRPFMESQAIGYRPYRDNEYFRHEGREEYFNSIDPGMLKRSVVLIDPDNGLEVKSMRRGNGHKYLKYRELRRVYDGIDDNSLVLVYQHIPRIKREKYFPAIAQKISESTGAEPIYLSNNRVVIFILAKGALSRAWQIIEEYAHENGYAADRFSLPSSHGLLPGMEIKR
jgi:hypothetical protein